MAKYQNKNKSVIDRAFERFQKQYVSTMSQGLVEIAEAALAYLVSCHENDPIHKHHIEDDNTIGYAVGFRGATLVASFGYEGGGGENARFPGNAAKKAEELVMSRKDGWSLVVLSEMDGWYDWTFEDEALVGSTKNFTRENFLKFFKQISAK